MAFILPFVPYIAGAVGALYAANQQKNVANYKASVDQQNADLTLKQTYAAEEAQRRQMALNMGQVRASASETGFDPSSGTLLNLQTRTAGEMELDVLTSRYRGQLEAVGLQQDAQVNQYNAQSAMRSGYLSAAGYVARGVANYLASTRIDPGGYTSRGAEPDGRPRGW